MKPILLLLLSATALVAPHPARAEQHAAQEAEELKHFLGAFVGGTRLPGEQGFTAGGEYEFRFVRRFGVGVTAETVGGNINENVLVALAYYHPVEKVGLFAGGGWDRRLKAAEEGDGEAAHADELRGRRPLARVGVAYEVPLGRRVAVNPNVSLDFAGGEVIVVFGLTLGFRF